jgi:3-oxoacid CoA-transferase subunit B
MGIGGAMDLAGGCRFVIAMMQHVTKKNEHKLVRSCDYPLTAAAVVSLVITDLGVFEPTGEGFRIVELAPGVTREHAQAATGAPLT